MRPVRFSALALAAALAAPPAGADVKLHALFSDGMVLQQGTSVPVWGTADDGEAVTVRFQDQEIPATAAGGTWQARLKDLRPGGPWTLAVSGRNTIEIRDVLVGEVWVGSGQSNMWWPVGKSADARQEIAQSDFPKIRLFTVKQTVADRPLGDVEGRWAACGPQTVAAFSAVAYYFGRDLHRTLDVPVGLIHSSWGGTPAEAWTTRATLEADPDFKPYVEQWDRNVAEYPQAKAKFEELNAEWKRAAEQAKAGGKPEPPPPRAPAAPDNPNRAAGLYNGMIAPLVPYSIRGVIWYQGEGNAGRAYHYRKLFPAMIADWRRAWGAGDFPFLFVQLANYKEPAPEPGGSDWAELREAQLMTLALPRTGMAVIIDIGDAKDIHPGNKQDVGRRLALAAQAVAYGRDVVHSGPIFESMSVEGDRARLRFRHVGGGLAARGGGPLKGFAIAGEDRAFVWAGAAIEDGAVVVRSDKVPKPVAVRYAWANNPECNLINQEGLPASPFRTDDWPGVTRPKP